MDDPYSFWLRKVSQCSLAIERRLTIEVCHSMIARWQRPWLSLVVRCGGTQAAVVCAICSVDGSNGQLVRQPWCCNCVFCRAETLTVYLL